MKNTKTHFLDLGTFNLVELGAGDGQKTKILLRYLESKQLNSLTFRIDFSSNCFRRINWMT